MKVKVTGTITNPYAIAISSKSYVHRMLIGAALSGGKSVLKSNIISKDMRATMECLNNLGADIEITDEGFEIKRGVQKCDKVSIDCNESGSTLRFMIPLVSYLCNETTITGKGKLPERPNGALTDTLRRNGAVIDSDFLPMNISGKLSSGTYEIAGNISSQYITGLLLTLPLLDGDSKIVLTSDLQSKPYVDITIEVLKLFGIKVKEKDYGYEIPGNQSYNAPSVMEAEGDWSNGAYLLSMGAVCGEIKVSNLNGSSIQGDREIVNILKGYGLEVKSLSNETLVKQRDWKSVDQDVMQIPDLLPAIAVLALKGNEDSIFRNVSRLRIKESDRIESVSKIISAFGGVAKSIKNGDEEDLVVSPVKSDENSEVEIDSYNDHRIVMAAVIAHLATGRDVIINGFEAVDKSYPSFIQVCRDMGMTLEVLD